MADLIVVAGDGVEFQGTPSDSDWLSHNVIAKVNGFIRFHCVWLFEWLSINIFFNLRGLQRLIQLHNCTSANLELLCCSSLESLVFQLLNGSGKLLQNNKWDFKKTCFFQSALQSSVISIIALCNFYNAINIIFSLRVFLSIFLHNGTIFFLIANCTVV